MKPRIEIWKSDQNQEERHYFMSNEANVYIFGFNPQLVDEKAADRILAIILGEKHDRFDRS